jgi:phosphatidylserine/phosphatidylglycerophosphate/cardiolipin synthase-like enzyme
MTASVRRTLCLALVLPFFALALVAGTGAAQATPAHFNPPKGPTFNNPFGTNASRFAINTKLIRTINSVRPGHKIRIASWNFRSTGISRALIRAHRRGVSVRVIMDFGNWNPDIPNPIAHRTHVALSRGDKHRKADMTSWLRRCKGSCRGPHGIAHTKFYTFDKVQHTPNVVMYGSANATLLAATIQWNDIFTVTNSSSRYREFIRVFDQMKRDRAVRQGYLHYTHGAMQLGFYPYTGRHTRRDPVLSVLNNVRCTGATRGTGINGHTKVRIAQTATYGNRGLAIAHRLAEMKKRGCNIRLVYAMFGRGALKVMRQDAGPGGVPMTHLAYDADCNGIYDKYVHMKSMTVSGVYGKNTHARITWNGSANWTPVSLASDEVVGRWESRRVTATYASWIDFLFTHVPAVWDPHHCETPGTVTERAAALHVDPYALIRQDL